MTNPKMLQALRISTFTALAVLATGCADSAPDDELQRSFSPQDNADLVVNAAPQPLAEGSVCIATDAFEPRFVDESIPLSADDHVYIEVLGAFACEAERIGDRFVLRPERDADSFEDVARCKLGPLDDGVYEVVVEGIEGARFPLAVPSRTAACLPPLAAAIDGPSRGVMDAASSPEPAALDRLGGDDLSSDAEAELQH